MALQDQKITSSDLANKGVVGLPDTPNLSTLVMQQKFDEIATAVIVPKFNALIDYLIEFLAPIVSDNPQDGEVLIYFADSSQYKNGVYRTTLSALKDVNVGGVQNKMFLCYDADRDLWYPEASSGVMETISACKDVSIVNPQTGDIFKFDGTAWANVPDERGLLIVFNIDSEDGATITALTPSGNTVTATSLGGGQYVIKSDEYGEWVLTGEKNGETVTTTVSVDTAKIYDVTMNFFAATITVTYPADATVTCSKDSEEYTATGSPYTFTVHESGDWVIEGTRSGITETQTVTITTNGQSESVTLTILPDGSTVTPTDSIPTLLHCADIWDKSYTSIGEVLADDDSLFKVLTTDNSIDYLVRSTTYASSVTADSDAMSMIGSYDYCADTLLGDSTWTNAIMGSAYKDSVVNVQNPQMTSNTAPYGVADGSLASSTAPYLAFDGNTSTYVQSAGLSETNYVGYTFTKAFKLKGFSILSSDADARLPRLVNISASEDGTTYSVAKNLNNDIPTLNVAYIGAITDDVTAKGVRVYFNRKDSSQSYDSRISEVKFYGRQNGGVQNWLRAGGITDKTYTTLAEVLADTTTLSALISNHNAVDYLVTAKAFIDGIVADATAMSYIGLNNYCANTLLGDASWCNGISNSTYKESVLNVKVPTMTSATTPSGEVFANSYGSSYYPWYAFGNKTAESQCWAVTGNQTGVGYIGYNFGRAVKIVAVMWKNRNSTQANRPLKVGTIQGSNDGTTWTDIADVTSQSNTYNAVTNGSFANNSAYSRCRILAKEVYDTGGLNMQAVQFYGREDV